MNNFNFHHNGKHVKNYFDGKLGFKISSENLLSSRQKSFYEFLSLFLS